MVGIYRITNTVNGKCYVGQSINIEKRLRQHKKGIDSNEHLQNSFKKYGMDKFEFEVIEECAISELNNRERYWIAHFKAFDEGYNSTLGGETSIGWKHSQETRRKMSVNHNLSGSNTHNKGTVHVYKGDEIRMVPVEEVETFLQQGYSYGCGDKFKETMREVVRGEKNPFYGKHHSEETRQKLRENAIRQFSTKGHPFLGKKHSEETKEKIRRAKLGKVGPNLGKTGKLCPMYGLKWMSDGTRSTRVHPDDVEKYIREGWHLGRH